MTRYFTVLLLCCFGAAIFCLPDTAKCGLNYNVYSSVYPDIGTPISNGMELFSNGGDVTVTYLGYGTAVFNDYLFLASPTPSPAFQPSATTFGAPSNFLFYNHVDSGTVDLGTFAAGTEMEFGLFVEDSNNNFDTTFYTGPGSRNPDGQVHAYVINNYFGPDTAYVGFEDWTDFNYADMQFEFQGLQGAPSSPFSASVPLPSAAWSGLTVLAGLAVVGVLRSCRRKTAA